MASGIVYKNVASGTTSSTVYSGQTALMGFTVRETAGATARVELRDGTADTDPLVAGRSYASSESSTDWFGPMGIRVTNGVRLVRPSGTTEVTVYVA